MTPEPAAEFLREFLAGKSSPEALEALAVLEGRLRQKDVAIEGLREKRDDLRVSLANNVGLRDKAEGRLAEATEALREILRVARADSSYMSGTYATIAVKALRAEPATEAEKNAAYAGAWKDIADRAELEGRLAELERELELAKWAAAERWKRMEKAEDALQGAEQKLSEATEALVRRHAENESLNEENGALTEALRQIAERPFTAALDAREMQQIAREALGTLPHSDA